MSEQRRLAFGKKNAPEVDPGAVKRLAFFWTTLTPVAQGYFDQLYEAMPEKVSTVLAGVELPRGGQHLTLTSWADSAKDERGILDLSALIILLSEIKIEPAIPGSRNPFAVVWSVSVEHGFPDRKDRVQLVDQDGKTVAEQIILQPAIHAGTPSEVQAKFEGLPNGSYHASLVVNVEGGDGTSMNEHGLQTPATAMFVVGEGREAQLAEDAPKFGEAQSLVESAISINADEVVRPDNQAAGTPDVLKVHDSTLEILAKAADALAGLDVLADGFKNALKKAAAWLRQSPYVSAEDWATLRGHLLGAQRASADPDEAGKYALSFIEALEEISPYPFVS